MQYTYKQRKVVYVIAITMRLVALLNCFFDMMDDGVHTSTILDLDL